VQHGQTRPEGVRPLIDVFDSHRYITGEFSK
jgi:hypothetical protein